MNDRTEHPRPNPLPPERQGFAAVAQAFRQLSTEDLERCADLLGLEPERFPAKYGPNYHEKLVWTLVPMLIFRQVSPADVLDHIQRTFGSPDQRRPRPEASPRMAAKESVEKPPPTLFRLITDHCSGMRLKMLFDHLGVPEDDAYRSGKTIAAAILHLFRHLKYRDGSRWVDVLKGAMREITFRTDLDSLVPLSAEDMALVEEAEALHTHAGEAPPFFELLRALTPTTMAILSRLYLDVPGGIFPPGRHVTHTERARTLAAYLERHPIDTRVLRGMIAEIQSPR